MSGAGARALVRGWLGPSGAVLSTTVLVGVGGMLGQLLLLRELMVTFYGNELTMGVVLATWLLAEALGALAGGHAGRRIRRHLAPYSLLLLAYAVLLPAALFYSRGIAFSLFDLVPGQSVGTLNIFVSCLVLLTPVSAVHGALYPLGYRLLAETWEEGSSAGLVYLYETLGTLLAGILFTLILAPRLDSLALAYWISVLHLVALAFLVGVFRPQTHWSRTGMIAAILAAAVLLVVSGPLQEWLHETSLQRHWRGQEVVHYENTPYGNITAVYSRGEHTFFYDGRPVITVPSPDTALISDFVHLVGAAHPEPRRGLVLGGGLGGILDQILRHPLEEVTYVELDPRLPQAVARFPNPLTRRELEDPRVSVEATDGRLFVARTDQQYDLVVLGFLLPDTLQSNRLFTGEFFSLVAGRLAPGGVVAFTLPGSQVYMSPEVRALSGSIHRTLSEIFDHVRIIPGDVNIFLASSEEILLAPEVISRRLEERGLLEGFISPGYVEYRLDPDRQVWAETAVQESGARANYDFNPAGFFYALAYWGAVFSPGTLEALRFLRELHLVHYMVPLLAAVLLIRLWMSRSGPRFSSLPVGFAIWSSGVAGMAFDLLALFVFQCLYGFVYQMAGLLMASFMAGAFLGGMWSLRRVDTGSAALLLRRLDLAIILLLLGLYGLTRGLQVVLPHGIDYPVFILIALFALVSGWAVGAQFPLAIGLVSNLSPERPEAASVLYACDLAGGFMGGFLVSIVLFPMLGLLQTLLLLALLKAGSYVLMAEAVAPEDHVPRVR